MVVFTCNNCGESLQKPKVEKHYMFACRSTKSLTCVDCFKDFRGEEYAVHTKCLTEDERYAAKGTYVNGITKKGEVKQESWIEMIKSILDKETNIRPSCRSLLNNISNYSNVPRKKNKFENFIKNSSGGRVNMKDVDEVWNIIENYKIKQPKNVEQAKSNKVIDVAEDQVSENGSSEKEFKNNENVNKRKTMCDEDPQEKIVKKKKKHKVVDDSLESLNNKEAEQEQEIKKFKFQEVILKIMSVRETIPLKKLQKKVINEYIKQTGELEFTQKMIKKFNKKLNKLSELEINDGVVAFKTTN